MDEIEDGDISSAETHHYRERLKDIQDEGVEGNITYTYVFSLKFPLDKFCSFLLLYIVIITAMVTIVTTVLLVLGARKVSHRFHTYDLAVQIITINYNNLNVRKYHKFLSMNFRTKVCILFLGWRKMSPPL